MFDEKEYFDRHTGIAGSFSAVSSLFDAIGAELVLEPVQTKREENFFTRIIKYDAEDYGIITIEDKRPLLPGGTIGSTTVVTITNDNLYNETKDNKNTLEIIMAPSDSVVDLIFDLQNENGVVIKGKSGDALYYNSDSVEKFMQLTSSDWPEHTEARFEKEAISPDEVIASTGTGSISVLKNCSELAIKHLLSQKKV